MIEIVDFFKTEIEALPQVKHFDLWNNQIYNEQVEKPFWTPAVFLNFESISWFPTTGQTSQSPDLFNQTGEVIIDLWLVFQSKQNNYDTFTKVIMPVRNLIVATFHNRNLGFGTLTRAGETYDNNHDNVIFWRISFKLDLVENVTNDDLQAQMVDFETNVDLLIDQPDIRTGKFE